MPDASSLLSVMGIAFAVLLGSLIGSFANVVIHRLPRGESVVHPGSHCPSCNRRLGPLELVPIASWVVLRGRCRGCRAAISPRYPLVEALFAVTFALLWIRWSPESHGWTFLPLAALAGILLILAAIDLDTYTLPDALTLPALAVALAAPLVYPASAGLPTPEAALSGAALGAGILTLVNRLGGLVMRRLADTAERLWPLGFDTVNFAALAGAVGGYSLALAAVAASLVVNLLARSPVRLPEGTAYGLWLLALLLSPLNPLVGPLEALHGTASGAGVAAILGAVYWWLRDRGGAPGIGTTDRDDADGPSAVDPGAETRPSEQRSPGGDPAENEHHDLAPGRGVHHSSTSSPGADPADRGDDEPATPGDDEPVAMGFGDVKLAAVLGAMLGPIGMLLALFLSFILGAAGGLALRAAGGGRLVPFGPYLVLAALLALFLGEPILDWYLTLLGV